MQLLLWWTNSTGSSIVMMWSLRVRFASSMMAASVVDLPLPVGPVTRTSPRGREASLEMTGAGPDPGGDDLARNLPEDRRTAELLLEKIGAVTGKPRNLIGEVDIPRLFELFDLVLGGDLVEHGLEAVIGQDVEFDPFHLPPDAERRLLAGDEMQVRCPLVMHQLEKGVNLCHGWPPWMILRHQSGFI